MTQQDGGMPGADELYLALRHVQHEILHGDKRAETQVALTEQTIEHLHDPLRLRTMAYTGTKLAHEPGHLDGRWHPFPRDIPEEQTHTVGLQAYDIIQISSDPGGRHSRSM